MAVIIFRDRMSCAQSLTCGGYTDFDGNEISNTTCVNTCGGKCVDEKYTDFWKCDPPNSTIVKCQCCDYIQY